MGTLKINQSKIETIQDNVLQKLKDVQVEIKKNETNLTDFQDTMGDSIEEMKLKNQKHHDSIKNIQAVTDGVKGKINNLQKELNMCVKDQQQTNEVIDNFNKKSNNIEILSGSVRNLENRYSETVEQIQQ